MFNTFYFQPSYAIAVFILKLVCSYILQGQIISSSGYNANYGDISLTFVVEGYEDISLGLNGFGVGLDLGITYDLSNVLTEGLVVSASLKYQTVFKEALSKG